MLVRHISRDTMLTKQSEMQSQVILIHLFCRSGQGVCGMVEFSIELLTIAHFELWFSLATSTDIPAQMAPTTYLDSVDGFA